MSEEAHPREPAPPAELDRPGGGAPPFGPEFFRTHLRAFVRDHCQPPGLELPFVHLHLAGGEVLDLCHVVSLTPHWAALAVFEEGGGDSSRRMRTELLPYDLLVRITIRAGPARGAHIGFRQDAPPPFHASPEEALQLAGAQPRGAEPGAITAPS
jgi:hypothetical protein